MDDLSEPPQSIEPYEVLHLPRDATADQIKDEAKTKFQEIAFAYAILSDERRRRRYDTTGNTSETLDLEDDDFNWADFFSEQYAAVVTGEAIEKIKKEYQGSEEERKDILDAFATHKGDMDAVYEEILCSNVLDDDERFRKIIDEAIEEGDAKAWKNYKQETAAKRKKRTEHAKREAAEAEELADELGVKDKLFGKGKKKGKQDDDTSALQALILGRQKDRANNFFDNLEAKYGGKKSSRGRKREEPPEEAFERNAKSGKKAKTDRGKK
ncbi:MAG: hypothetical protein Q9227_000926 [Pyrenula ochraceoflavens]